MLLTVSAGLLGAALVVTLMATYARRSPEERTFRSQYLARIDSLYADTAIARFHYTKTGSGPPVLLLAGGCQWLFSYRETIPALSRHFTVLAVDLPGQGYTTINQQDFRFDFKAMDDALGAFLDAVKLDRVSIVGHSWGGSWSLYFAQRHPERVDRLVLINTPAREEPPSWEFRPLRLPVIDQLAAKWMRKSDFARQYRKCFSNQDRVTREMVDENWAPASRRQNREALWKLERRLDYQLTEKSLDRIQCPTLVMWGGEDRFDQPWQAHDIARRIPGAVVEILPGCGHSPHEERPDLANPVLVRFLGGTN